jgi:hypothetical protein
MGTPRSGRQKLGPSAVSRLRSIAHGAPKRRASFTGSGSALGHTMSPSPWECIGASTNLGLRKLAPKATRCCPLRGLQSSFVNFAMADAGHVPLHHIRPDISLKKLPYSFWPFR